MPFEILDHNAYLELRLFGVLAEGDVHQISERLKEIESSQGGAKNRITDLTGIEDDTFGFTEVFAAAKARSELQLPVNVKSAFIARRPMHVGFARMFQTLNENPRIEVRVLETVEEALRWFESE
jgi:hypothetical protein